MATSALIDELEKQFADNPRRVFARLANEYRKTGELDRAIAICRSHIPHQPSYISGYIVLGQALFESGRHDEARQTFESALNLDPENLIALRQLGDIARMNGDVENARGWYQRLLECDPQNEEATAQLEALSELESFESEPAAAFPTEVDVAPEPVRAWETAPEPALSTAPAPREEPEPIAASESEPGASESPVELGWAQDDFPAWPEGGADPFAAEAPGTRGVEEAGVVTPGPRLVDDQIFPDFREVAEAHDRASELLADARVEKVETLDAASLAFGLGPEDAVAEERPSETIESGLSAAGAGPLSSHVDALDSRASVEAQMPAEVEATEADASIVADDLSPAMQGDSERVAPMYDPSIGRSVEEAEAAAPAEAPPAAPSIVTQTMADLYLDQGFTGEAIKIYRELLEQRPEDEELRARLRALEDAAPPVERTETSTAAAETATAGEARVEEDHVPDRRAAPPLDRALPVRSFFRELARRRAPAEFASADNGRPATFTVLGPLFQNAPVSEADQLAALALAGAFDSDFSARANDQAATPEPSSAQLSLDAVFARDAGAAEPEPRSGGAQQQQQPDQPMTFEQFLGGRDAAGKDVARPDDGKGTKADLDQFHAWLDGLK